MSRIVELRQYTLKPGRRDALIELFEREFIESQEAVGMEILGTFRDAGNPDRFVWLRGFPDMESRAKSLAAFYGGPVWQAHREAANATMIDSDNVLLLRPAWPGAGFHAGPRRAFGEEASPPRAAMVASIWDIGACAADEVAAAFRSAASAIAKANPNAQSAGAFVTEQGRNTFPALPVREGEDVFVWFALVPSPSSAPPCLPEALDCTLAKLPELVWLLPTARSPVV